MSKLQIPTPSPPPQGCRFEMGKAFIACELILLAAGLGLLALTPVPAVPLAAANQDGARFVHAFLPNDRVASPRESLEEILANPDVIPTHHHPLLGRPAPAIDLADHEGKVRNLRLLLDGRPGVLIFYYGFHCGLRSTAD